MSLFYFLKINCSLTVANKYKIRFYLSNGKALFLFRYIANKIVFWHFRNFPLVDEKKDFLKKFSQNFGKIPLRGVVVSKRKIRGLGKLPNKQKSPAVGRQKTDNFKEMVPLSYACYSVFTSTNCKMTEKEWKSTRY